MSPLQLTIAITGANGQVGTGVVRQALLENHSVIAIDTAPQSSLPQSDQEKAGKRFTYKQVDCTQYEPFRSAVRGADGLVHLAAVYNRHDHDGNLEPGASQNVVHNTNTAMSYNALLLASELGIDRVVLASSVNSIGMVFSKRPRFDYIPLDEKHPFYPEDAYSLCKHIVEIQSDAFVRFNPTMRIATLRFHAVTDDDECTASHLNQRGGSWKDLWGWVSLTATAKSCLLGLTAPYESFPKGTHETFFIVAPTTQQQADSEALLRSRFPEIQDVRIDLKGSNVGFFDTSKAEKLLGWKEGDAFWWKA